MTASIQQKKGYYYIQIRYKDGEKWSTKTYSTHLRTDGNNKRKAEKLKQQYLNDFEETIRAEENEANAPLLVSDYFKEWLAGMENKVAPNTYRSYLGNMNNHIIPYFAERKIALVDLKTYHLDKYFESRAELGLSPQTIKHHKQNISKALNDAIRQDLIYNNPVTLATTPKAKQFKAVVLNPEQLVTLIGLLEGEVIRVPVLLTIYLGLRRSEVLGLRWQSVDFVNQTITINHTVLQHVGGEYEGTTKTASSYRTLTLPGEMMKILQEQKLWQTMNQKIYGARYTTSDDVCTDRYGNRIKPNYFSTQFSKIVKRSELPHVRLHDLRHSCASNLLANGFSVKEVQEWLGHSSPSTTLNFYVHINSDKSKQRVSKAIDEMLSVKEQDDMQDSKAGQGA